MNKIVGRYAKYLNGKIIKYPYTLDDLLNDHPDINLLIQDHIKMGKILDNFFSYEDIISVIQQDAPEITYKESLIEDIPAEKFAGIFYQSWKIIPATAEEISERTAKKAKEIRQQRNELLAKCDWTQVSDVPSKISDAYKIYRKELRNISLQDDFPWQIIWPVEPNFS